MTRPTCFRLALACAAAGALAAMSAADDPPPERLKEAERVFKDVYGKEFDRVSKGKSTADKAAFAKRLWDAARETKGDPALVRVLGDKAIGLAAADPAGVPIAVEIKRSRVTDGKDRAEQLAAVAFYLDRQARNEKPEKRAALAAEAVELYREAAELETDAGHAASAGSYTARARAAAQALLPPAQAAVVLKDIAVAQADADAARRLAAELDKLADLLAARPEDPQWNRNMVLALLRAGRPADAAKHFPLASSAKLRAIGEALAAKAPDPAALGNLYRDAADEFPAEKAALLGLARQQYEAALAADPKHPDANRMRFLVKELPPFKPVGARVPAGVVELIDENPAVADWLARDKTATAAAEWTTSDRLLGRGCLRVVPAKVMTAGTITFRDDAVWKFPITDAPGDYRHVAFSYRQVGGTRLVVRFYHDSGVHGQPYLAGPPGGLEKVISLGDRPSAEWTTVTRDLFLDHGGVNPSRVCGIGIETDGAVYLDGVLLARTARELKRAYKTLSAKIDAKP
jgi:hypothetical protein